MGITAPEVSMVSQPNPTNGSSTLRYHLPEAARMQITVYDATGRAVKTLVNKRQEAGTYSLQWDMTGLADGSYFITAEKNGAVAQTLTVVKQ
jgi:flagellar hook assembly protein FlgD